MLKGTFDVSILSIDEGVYEVKSVGGNSHLGGSDFDQILTNYLIEEFLRKNKSVTRKDITDKMIRKLRSRAESAKITLSSATQVMIEVESFYNGIDFSMTLTRAKFENLCESLFRETLDAVSKALLDANISKLDIHDIVLVGGSTRIPKVQELLKDYFNGKD